MSTATNSHQLERVMHRRREVFVHTRHTRANITPTLAGAVLLCLCAQARGQDGAQTQTFVIHGTPRTCTAITQLDSALLADSPQFFAGWTESDYAEAVAWSQACAQYGWQVPWRPRIPLLTSQHDRALKSAQTQTVSSMATAGTLPNPSAQSPTAPPVAAPDQAEPSAAAGSALQGPPVQAAIAAPVQSVPNAAPAQVVPTVATMATVATVLPSAAVQTVVAPPTQAVASAATAQAVPIAATDNVVPTIAAPPQAVPIAAAGSALPSRVQDHMASDGQEDSVLADNYFKEHFHQESLWVAGKANLDIGDDRAPSAWSSSGKPAQMKNRLTADRIVLYCSKKTNSGESGKRPLLWDLRWCEAEEASAYNRLVSGNEFPTAGRAVVLGCAGVDSYVYLERCMATLTESGMH